MTSWRNLICERYLSKYCLHCSLKKVKLYYFTNTRRIKKNPLQKKVDAQAPLPFPHCYVPVLRLFIELQNLIKDLKSELGGDLLKVVLACMIPPAEFDARELNKAMEVRPLRTLPP